MADTKHPNGPGGEEYYPPPPSGPPPGHNGLAMNPNENLATPDARSDIYNASPRPANAQPQQQYPSPPSPQPQYQQHQQNHHAQHHPESFSQQTAHRPPPPDSDGAPKKAGWSQRFSALSSKAAAPINSLANKMGSESFLPSTMDKECEKAARILKSFCKEGIYTDASATETVPVPATDPQGNRIIAPAKPRKNRTLLTIPASVLSKAVGLAIFTTARAGFHFSGATGSGIIVARLPDGSWSPPSGIQVHSAGFGFMMGMDIYDCVVVINTPEALHAFTQTRMSFGTDLAVVAGPWGAGGSMDIAAPQSSKGKGKARAEERPPLPARGSSTGSGPSGLEPTADEKSSLGADRAANNSHTPNNNNNNPQKPSALKSAMSKPTFSYVKSRGFYAGVQVDGTIVTERRDANSAFYGEPVSVQQVLRGDLPLIPGRENWVNVVKPLFDVIKAAEGKHQGQQRTAAAAAAAPAAAPSKHEEAWANQRVPDEYQDDLDDNHSVVYSTAGDTKDPYGNGPAAYPSGFDPVSDAGAQRTGSRSPKPPSTYSSKMSGGAGGAGAAAAAAATTPTASMAAMSIHSGRRSPTSPSLRTTATGLSEAASHRAADTPGARAKAAEAAAEAEMNREREERERRELEEEEAAGAAAAAPSLRGQGVDRRATWRDSVLTTAPPGYSEMAGPDEASYSEAGGAAAAAAHGGAGGAASVHEDQPPPAYVEDGAPRPGVGDTKGGAGPAS